MTDIQLVLFDIGGVIQKDNVRPAGILGISDEKYDELGKLDEWQDYLRGSLSFDEFAHFLVGQLRRKATSENIDQIRRAVISTWELPDEGMVKVIKKVDSRFRKMILSTSTIEIENHVRASHQDGTYSASQRYLQLFDPDDVVFSHHIHATKREAKAFAAVENICHILPDHWVFIDDRKHNLEVARKFGVGHTILFFSVHQAESELYELGIFRGH